MTNYAGARDDARSSKAMGSHSTRPAANPGRQLQDSGVRVRALPGAEPGSSEAENQGTADNRPNPGTYAGISVAGHAPDFCGVRTVHPQRAASHFRQMRCRRGASGSTPGCQQTSLNEIDPNAGVDGPMVMSPISDQKDLGVTGGRDPQ